KFALAHFRVMPVPAAHTPMKRVFSLLTSGTIANDTGVSIPPKIAATFSWKMSSRAAISPFGGFDSSSLWMSSSLRPPSTPPLSLISSIARASPRVIASPDCAEAPDKAATCPIFTGSAANAVAAANDNRTAVASIDNGAPLRSRNIEHLFHILISPSVQAWAETPFHISRDYCPSAQDRVEVPRGGA